MRRWRSSTSGARTANVAEVMHIIGDVEGGDCLIVDDLIDTAGTLVKATEALLEQGRDERFGLRDARGAVGPGGGAD